MYRFRHFFAYGVWLVSFLSWGCGFQPVHETRTFLRMDTVVDVTLVIRKRTDLNVTWESIDSLLADWEARFSQTHPKSEVLALNNKTGAAARVSPILASMIKSGIDYGDTLAGDFDITVLPLKELWALGEKETEIRVPPADSLAQVLAHVDYRQVHIDTRHHMVEILDPLSRVDVGGLAKGYSLEYLGRLLHSLGYEDFLIAAGGDIISSGRRKTGEPWKIGVRHPRKKDGNLAYLDLDSGSLVTSGDYERYWMKEGKRYHHIFSTGSGMPCWENQSLTIWGPGPVEADILSTGLFCRSKDSILAFVNARRRLECLVVDSHGNAFVSSGWKDKVHFFNNDPTPMEKGL